MAELLDRFMRTIQLAQMLKQFQQMPILFQQQQEDRQRQIERENRQIEREGRQQQYHDYGIKHEIESEGGLPVTNDNNVFGGLFGERTTDTPVGKFSVPTYKEKQRRLIEQLRARRNVEDTAAVKRAGDIAEVQAGVKERHAPRIKITEQEAKTFGFGSTEVTEDEVDARMKIYNAQNKNRPLRPFVDRGTGNVKWFDEAGNQVKVSEGVVTPSPSSTTDPKLKSIPPVIQLGLKKQADAQFETAHPGGKVESEAYKSASDERKEYMRNTGAQYEKGDYRKSPEWRTIYEKLERDWAASRGAGASAAPVRRGPLGSILSGRRATKQEQRTGKSTPGVIPVDEALQRYLAVPLDRKEAARQAFIKQRGIDPETLR